MTEPAGALLCTTASHHDAVQDIFFGGNGLSSVLVGKLHMPQQSLGL